MSKRNDERPHWLFATPRSNVDPAKAAEHVIAKTVLCLLLLAGILYGAYRLYWADPDILFLEAQKAKQERQHQRELERRGR